LFPSHFCQKWKNQETLFPACFRKVRNPGNIAPSHVSGRWTN
jgi:hypothetical protein